MELDERLNGRIITEIDIDRYALIFTKCGSFLDLFHHRVMPACLCMGIE